MRTVKRVSYNGIPVDSNFPKFEYIEESENYYIVNGAPIGDKLTYNPGLIVLPKRDCTVSE
jgi:hypothetical protein